MDPARPAIDPPERRRGLSVHSYPERVQRQTRPIALTPSQAVHLARTQASARPRLVVPPEREDPWDALLPPEPARPESSAPSPASPEGATVLPEQGATVLPEQGATMLPEHGATMLPEQGGATLPEQRDTVRPASPPAPSAPPPQPRARRATPRWRRWLARILPARNSAPSSRCTLCALPVEENGACRLGHRRAHDAWEQ